MIRTSNIRRLWGTSNFHKYGARRTISDIAITRTGKTLLKYGAGGRSSISGHTATVFGAGGFLGREEMNKRHLKVSGDLGQVVFLEFDLRNQESIDASVRHSDIVYNLIGRDYETKNFTYNDVHVEGARAIAESVAKYDVDRFVHVSSYNADKASKSKFYATKALGEETVRSIFPEATIVRPSVMYGVEDRLLNRLASNVNLFNVNHNRETMYPVHVLDVARALERMMLDDSTNGQIYELHGPDKFSMADIAKLVNSITHKSHRHINIPAPVMIALAKVFGLVWWPTISPDEVTRQFIDQKIDRKAKTFADLHVEPERLPDLATRYLRRYRSNTFYDAPPDTEKERKRLRETVHVID